jgi:hypothetical protein
VHEGNESIISLLLEYGADRTVISSTLGSAISCATRLKNEAANWNYKRMAFVQILQMLQDPGTESTQQNPYLVLVDVILQVALYSQDGTNKV